MPQHNRLYSILRICLFALTLAACSKDKTPPAPTGPVTQKEINNWMLDSMRYFYLWNSSLPRSAEEETATQDSFKKLKNPADRFSFVYNPSDPATYPKYMLYIYGMDFTVIAWPSSPSGAIGVVKYVLPGSPADQQGFKRGNYFTRINGTAVTTGNAAALSEALLQQTSATFTPATVSDAGVTEGNAITIQQQAIGENPVAFANTRTVSGKRIGYLFYNYFNDGYNVLLKSAFQDFKNNNINDLILDLRYNPGGSVAAAAQLVALIAPGINEQSGFVKYSGNNYLGQRMISFQSALSVPESGEPISFGSLASARLSLPRVFILCSGLTTSAAELTINNLKPYTQVILIGEKTYGKDKGAIIIRDERTPQRIPWILQPISYNLANAKGEGGYTQGITPQYTVDELSKQPLLPIGDSGDPLVARAVAILTGNGRMTDGAGNSQPVLRYYDSHQQMADFGVVRIPARLVR